ncbi:hypothetical protein GCM10022378_09150 [Salinicoccus jeotgali]|uniref:DUF732 domain-containing protein n=1 Tax=Salinicoccus jeotgali TaxID=381634 RepID=A0ABP7ENE3_9STAP
MSKKFALKTFFMILALVLTISSTLSLNASASTQELKTEEAVQILESLNQSSVQMADGTSLINENKLKENLGSNKHYDEIYTELKNANMLTTKENPNIATMASDNRNPKWVAARDACASQYLKDEFSVAALGSAIGLVFAGNWSAAAKELVKNGAKVTPAGLAAVYVHMNYTCIKEANSKHSVY